MDSNQSPFAPLFQPAATSEAQPTPDQTQDAPAVGFNSPEYQQALEQLKDPKSVPEQDSKAIDILNSVRTRSPNDLANQYNNDDTALIGAYRANQQVFDSDPDAKQKFLDAYRIARSQPFSVSGLIGGFASGLLRAVPALASSGYQAGKDLVTGNGDKVAYSGIYAVKETGQDIAKAKDNVVRLLSTGTTLPQDDAGWQNDFNTAVQRDAHLDQLAHGDGMGFKYNDQEAQDIRKDSLVANPTNIIPFEAGLGVAVDLARSAETGERVFQFVNKAGQAIREVPVASQAGKAISALGSAAKDATAGTFSKVGGVLAKTGAAFDAAKGSIIGGLFEGAGKIPGAGVLVGALSPKTLELAGNGLVNTGLKLRGVVPWGGVVNTIGDVASHPLVRSAVEGAKAASGLTGDPLALGFTGLNVASNFGNGQKIGESLGSNAAIGAAAHVGAEPFKGEEPQATGTFQGQDAQPQVSQFNPPPAPKPVQSPAYGVIPGFDQLHEQAMQELPKGSQNFINAVRETVRPSGGQVYVLPPQEYARAILDYAQYENRKSGPLTDAQAQAALRSADASKGVFTPDLPTAEGAPQKVILLNQDGSALDHETGHLVDAILPPQERAQLRQVVRKAYTPAEINDARDRYEQLLGQDISEPAAVDELIAENFTKILAGTPVDQLGAPRQADAALTGALEKAFGKSTDLGFIPKVEVAAQMSKTLAKGIPAAETKPEAPVSQATPVAPQASAPTPVRPRGKAAPTGPKPVIQPKDSTNIRVTRDQQNDFARESRGSAPSDTGSSSALATIAAKGSGYTPHHIDLFDKVDRVVRAGASTPFEIDYNSAVSDKHGADRAERADERALHDADRRKVQKIFVPNRWTTASNGRVVLQAFSLDKVRHNIDLLASELSQHGATDLSPYEIRNGKFTESASHSLINDVQTYLQNQAHGFGGNGQRVKVPADYYGSLPAEAPGYVPQRLSEERSQFINTLMGRDLGPPRTTRASASRPVPANVSARQLAEANNRPVEVSALAPADAKFPAKFGGGPITDTNPLRNAMVKRGVALDRFHEVTENLDLKRITNVKARPDLNFSRPSTDLIRAGFMPDPNKAARSGNPEVRTIAEDYVSRAGIPYEPYDGYAKLPEDLGKRIADWFETAPSEPGNPAVQSAYRSLIDQVKSQYDAMTKAGYKIEPWSGKGEPYKSSADMVRDVKEHKHLWFLPTDSGFGSNEHFDVSKNPMLAPTGVEINGKKLVANDLFRAVHDFYGHAKEGYEFGPRGEYNAFVAHSTMFTPEALPALAAETLAQNAWVNYGPHLRREDGSLPVKGDADFKPLQERPFADQKVTIVPPELVEAAEQNALGELPKTGMRFQPAETPQTARFLYEQKYKTREGEEKTQRYYQTPGTAEHPRGFTVDEATAREKGFEVGEDLQKKYPELANLREGEMPIEVQGADGKVYPARMNGYWDNSYVKLPDTPAIARLKEGGWSHGGLREGEKIITPIPSPEEWKAQNSRARFQPDANSDLTSNSKYDSNTVVPTESTVDSTHSPKLLNAVGGQIRVVHLSGNPGLPKLLLQKFGKGMSHQRDLRGLPKVYFFEEGSPLGGDKFWAEGRHLYGAKLDGDKIYDGNTDALGYWSNPNQEERDQMLIDHGYDGVAVETRDGRRVIMSFKDQDVTPLGRFGDSDRVGSNLAFKPATPESTARAKVADLKQRYPEALPLAYRKNEDGSLKVDEDGAPQPISETYDLYNTPLAKEAGKGIRNEDKKSDAIADAYAGGLEKLYHEIASRPEIMAAKGWYSVARHKIKNIFGDDTVLFTQLLGATSARTGVADNYRQSIDAYRKFKNGDYDKIIAKYKEGLAKLADGSLMEESGQKTEAGAMKWWIQQNDLVPRKSNGQKFNANSGAVMRVLAGDWENKVQGPKTPNFTGNLNGKTLEATIDLWAARTMRRVGFEGTGKRWRILPEAETGVTDPDFYLAQTAYRKAAHRLGLNPDDLQAILWFAEKDHWERKGWTRGQGSEKSSYHHFLDRTRREDNGQVVLDETGQKELNLTQ